LGQIRQLARELRANRYDVAADLRGDFRNVLTAFVARIPRRYGFPYSGFDYLLTDIVPGPVEQVGTVHQVDEVSHMAELLGAGPLPGAPRIDPPEEDRDFARRWLAEHGRSPDRPLVALHLSAGMPARLWPIDSFIDVARHLKNSRDAQFLVVGAAGERALGEQLGAALGERPLIAAGDATLVQSIALLELCRLFIGTDSGPAHLASAARCPLVVLFGPGNVQVMRPYTDRCAIVRSPRPCDPRCHNKTCAVPETHCMKAISLADVITAAETLLNQPESTVL
jgi:ADP-heptose:LPS heptosyltransferase